MYEGCNKTALTSQSAIADALLSLMEEKPYTRISVSEICKSAGVSRQTFYTLFESKDNVIAFELERKYCFRPEEHLLQDNLYNSFLSCSFYLPECPGRDRVYAADFLAGGLTGVARNYVQQDSTASSISRTSSIRCSAAPFSDKQ